MFYSRFSLVRQRGLCTSGPQKSQIDAQGANKENTRRNARNFTNVNIFKATNIPFDSSGCKYNLFIYFDICGSMRVLETRLIIQEYLFYLPV